MAFQGSCYLFSTQQQHWFEAKDHCAEKGDHLVIINSQAEQVGRWGGVLWGPFKSLQAHVL